MVAEERIAIEKDHGIQKSDHEMTTGQWRNAHEKRYLQFTAFLNASLYMFKVFSMRLKVLEMAFFSSVPEL